MHLNEDVTADVCVRFFRALNQSYMEHHLSVKGLKYQTVEPFTVGLTESVCVKVLDLSSVNESNSNGAVSIFTSLEHNTSLEELNLSGNTHLTEGDSEAVGCAIERMLIVNRTLRVLELSLCGLDSAVVKHFGTGLTRNASLSVLNISYNGSTSPEGWVHLFWSLHQNSSVKNLDISGNKLEMKGSEALATCLTHNAFITQLNIRYTLLTPEGCVLMFKSLHRNSSVKKLDISGNKLGMEGSEALAEMLSYNKSLTELNICFTEAEIRVIMRGLLQNTTLETIVVQLMDKQLLEEELKRLQASGHFDTSRWNLNIALYGE